MIIQNWKKIEWHSILQKSSGDRQGVCPPYRAATLWWTLFFFFTTREIRTGRAFEITNKMAILQNHRLTSIDSTKNPCSKAFLLNKANKNYVQKLLESSKRTRMAKPLVVEFVLPSELKVSKIESQFSCSHVNQNTNKIIFWYLP